MRKDMRRREKKVKSCLDGLFALADPTIKTCLKTFELVSKHFWPRMDGRLKTVCCEIQEF